MFVIVLMIVRRPRGGHGRFCYTIAERFQRKLSGVFEELTVEYTVPLRWRESVVELLGEAV